MYDSVVEVEPVSCPMTERWVMASGFLFALTFQKYAARDPLSQSAGGQAVLEIGLTLLPTAIIVLLSRGRPMRLGLHRSLWFFMIYGIFAVASGLNSFNPPMSMVKGVLFFSVLLMAYLLAELKQGIRFLEGIYRGYIATMVGALIVFAVAPHPLFVVDDYNGRVRLNLLPTHPNSIGETSAFLFLLALILPIRTRWYWQAFLLALNVAAGEKTSTGAVILASALIFAFGHKDLQKRWKALAMVGALASAGLVCVWAGVAPISPDRLAGKAVQSMYGKEVGNEVGSLDGRLDVWAKSADMARDCAFLGFGFEGAREYLLVAIPWAGHAHNGIIQALLTAGIPGVLALMVGWACSLFDSLNGNREWNVRILAMHVYLLALVMVGPAFDSPSYFTMLLFVVVLYAAIDRQSERELPQLSPVGSMLQVVTRERISATSAMLETTKAAF